MGIIEHGVLVEGERPSLVDGVGAKITFLSIAEYLRGYCCRDLTLGCKYLSSFVTRESLAIFDVMDGGQEGTHVLHVKQL